MPNLSYRKQLELIDGLARYYSAEQKEVEVRLAHFPPECAGADYLKGRLNTIAEHIGLLEIRRAEIVKAAEDQDRYIQRSGLLNKRSKR